MFNQQSHPWTFRVARIAINVGEFTMMHYKRLYSRPRPSQLCPALLPPIAVPPHASYPSGHATQAWLLSRLLEKILPDVVTLPKIPAALPAPPIAPTDPNPAPQGILFRMAERVARNREVMGLHYPSDSAGGYILAKGIVDILKNVTNLPVPDPTISIVSGAGPVTMSMLEIINEARNEWAGQTTLTVWPP
jgi:hypothetical protein